MKQSHDKRIIIIAGPNGAGKTTFARSFLPVEAHCARFFNADLIAAGLSPFAPEDAAIKAGRVMLQEIAQCVERGLSFAFETTLAGSAYLRHIRAWRAAGYEVTLHYLSLPTVDLAVERVAQRVRHGGHAIPEATIRRRYAQGWRHFVADYQRAVDSWELYDNSGDRPELIDWSHQ